VARRQCRRLESVRDLLDQRLAQAFAPGALEAHVAAESASRDARIAETRDFLGGVVEHAAAPQRAVEALKRLPERWLMAERPAQRRIVVGRTGRRR